MSEISWEEATSSNGFVKIEPEKEKKLKVKNFRFEKIDKFGNEQIEFQADVVEEDGESVKDKLFTTTSRRLKAKLRPVFEDKKPDSVVTFSVMAVGEGFSVQYSVKELVD